MPQPLDNSDLEKHVRAQVAAEIAKSSEIAVYGNPSYDEVTRAINGLTQAEFLTKVFRYLEAVLSIYFQPFGLMDWLPINSAPKDELPKWVRYVNRNEPHYCWVYWNPACEGWVEARVNGHRLKPTDWHPNPWALVTP